MVDINTLSLKDAKPSDRPHLLIWDNPQELALQTISFYNNAVRVNYRDHLLSRLNPEDNFLLLHRHLDRELDSLRSICAESVKPIVIVEGLDYLITYLSTHSGEISLFWSRLNRIRQLRAILWLVLPSLIVPSNLSQLAYIKLD